MSKKDRGQEGKFEKELSSLDGASKKEEAKYYRSIVRVPFSFTGSVGKMEFDVEKTKGGASRHRERK